MGMHATKDRVESDTSTVDSISLYESTITTRDEPGFGEFQLALGVIGLPVTARDRILRCSLSVVGTTRAGPGLDSFQKDEGTEVTNSPSHLGRKTNRHLDVIQPFPFFVGKERRSPSEPSNEEIRGEQSANGARSACGRGTEK
jgi:hypothetical protein